MEYGIGVQNRYALFLDGEDDAADPYAVLTNAADSEPKAKATATAAGGKPGPKTPAGGVVPKPSQKPSPGALTESKANVSANQKDAGKCHAFVATIGALQTTIKPSHIPIL